MSLNVIIFASMGLHVSVHKTCIIWDIYTSNNDFSFHHFQLPAKGLQEVQGFINYSSNFRTQMFWILILRCRGFQILWSQITDLMTVWKYEAVYMPWKWVLFLVNHGFHSRWILRCFHITNYIHLQHIFMCVVFAADQKKGMSSSPLI